jgi:hypothetical protein
MKTFNAFVRYGHAHAFYLGEVHAKNIQAAFIKMRKENRKIWEDARLTEFYVESKAEIRSWNKERYGLKL